MSKLSTLSVFSSGSHPHCCYLKDVGYTTVFDIALHSRALFLKTVTNIHTQDAHQIYQDACVRAESLKFLFRSWQLRHENTLSGLGKFEINPTTKLQDTLLRNIGGDDDFSNLMMRSSQYADAASIQSLFAPGRYVTSLYKVAKTLHKGTSVLHIDNRRPDLKDLPLSETTMNKEVTSLDILLDVLQADSGNDLNSLSDAYFPMTLPYDDDLIQINIAMDSQKLSLKGIWNVLADIQSIAFANGEQASFISASDIGLSTTASPITRTTLSLTPLSYTLLVKQVQTELDISTHYGLDLKSELADLVKLLNVTKTFCQKTALTFNQLLELTAQEDYTDPDEKTKNMSRYIKFGSKAQVCTYNYGAVFLNGGLSDISVHDNWPLWVKPESRDSEGAITLATLNFQNETVLELAGRAEKLIRLKNKINMSFEMLDWVINNACVVAGFKTTLDKRVLDTLANCVDFQRRYGIDVNTFVSFFGDVNPYAPAQEKSFYEALFTYPNQTGCIPLGSPINYLTPGDDMNVIACCKAVGVTFDEFSRIGQYCFGSADSFIMSATTAGQIYRFGAIPRMLGMTFAEAECLWQLMSQGSNNLLVKIGQNKSFSALDIIHDTEQVRAWMIDKDLTLIQIRAMVSNTFSAIATAEMVTFLKNIYHSVKGPKSPLEMLDDSQRKSMLRVMAGGLNLKSNIMARLTDWLSNISTFTLDNYWAAINTLFDDRTSVGHLSQKTALVISTQRLSQLVLIVDWLSLSEQDLILLIDKPEQLDCTFTATPSPDLSLLLLMSRFKDWQTQVTVSRDEALQLLPYLISSDVNAQSAANKIAKMHDLNTETVMTMNTLLFKDNLMRPQDFVQLRQLLMWLRTGQTLNVSAATLNDLQTMMQNDDEAEKAPLIARVAQNLAAGIRLHS